MSVKERVKGVLALNTSLTIGCPSIPGKNYFESEKVWLGKKVIIERKIVKDLDTFELEERTKTGNNQAFMLVLEIVLRELQGANFQSKAGTFPIWASIFSKAKGRVKKTLTGQTDLSQFSKGLLKNAKESTFGACNQTRLQDTPSRQRG